jgi:hypothetical protein
MDDPLAEKRRQLTILCRRKSSRLVPTTLPTKWHPQPVYNADGERFGSDAAWEFVADCLDDVTNPTIEFNEVDLDKPFPKKGYVINVDLAGQRVYIALLLGAGKVLGKSFHPSEPHTV